MLLSNHNWILYEIVQKFSSNLYEIVKKFSSNQRDSLTQVVLEVQSGRSEVTFSKALKWTSDEQEWMSGGVFHLVVFMTFYIIFQ